MGPGRGGRAGAVGLLGLVLVGCAGGTDGPAGTPPSVTALSTSEASPSPTSPPAPPGAAAELTVTLDETGSGATRTLTLTCEPVGGDHPDAAAACATLAAVGSDGFEEVPADAMCTQQYGGPQVATVEGTLDGAPVSARFTRTDGCEIGRWDTLAPLLPASGGGM